MTIAPYLESKFSQLDLQFMIKKLASEHYELARWPENLAIQLVEFYRRFLWLNYKYPGSNLVPTRDIDECWHIHILSTKRYAEDCQNLFGHYLHHQPADPSNQEEITVLQTFFDKTLQLYQKEFGEDLKVLSSE